MGGECKQITDIYSEIWVSFSIYLFIFFFDGEKRILKQNISTILVVEGVKKSK